MAKRMTDTGKWVDGWFCDLPPLDKLFWQFLCDNCDHAGVWKVNLKMVRFMISEDYTPDLAKFEDRIKDLGNGRWFVPKFIEFQYGRLHDNNHAHVSVIKALRALGLDEYVDANSGEYQPARLRAEIYREFSGRCAYCDDKVQLKYFHIDHIVPRAKGGADKRMNMAAACSSCNVKKGTDTLQDFCGKVGLNHEVILARIALIKKGHQSPFKGEKDKDKEKDKAKDLKDHDQRQNGNSFEAFYAAYPRKVGRAAAEKAWAKHAPDAELAAKILAAVEAQKAAPRWKALLAKGEKEFIPHPSTWLNQRRWEDEVAAPPAEADQGPYVITDEVHRLICAYKMAVGLDWRDRAWDRNCLTDEIRSAAQGLLEAFDGQGRAAGQWLQGFAAEMKGKGLSWTLGTAKIHAWRTKGERASAAHYAEARGQAPPRAQRPLGEPVIDKKPTGFTSGADLTAGLLPQESHFEPET